MANFDSFNGKFVAVCIASFLAGIPAGIALMKSGKGPTREVPESCFADKKEAQETTLAEVDARSIHFSSLPADLRVRLRAVQSDAYVRSRAILEEFAVRRSLTGSETSSNQLPLLEQLNKDTLGDEELKNFYAANKPAFGGRTFEELKDDLKRQILQRRAEILLKNKRDELLAKKYFKIHLSPPCGQINHADFDDAVDYFGKKTAPISIEFFTDYSLESRILDAKLMKSIQNKETEFRVVLFPASAKTGGEEDQLARGFWCASQQSKEAAINFHRYAVSRPQKNSSGRATDAEEISRIVDAAAGFGIDQQRLQACLVSESTAKDSAGRVQRLTKAEIGPGPKLYINKREVLLSNMLEIDDVISSLSSAMNIGQK